MTSTVHHHLPRISRRAATGTTVSAGGTGETVSRAVTVTTHAPWFTALRFVTGFVFLWAFLDKLFGFGYSTPSAGSWINGGSPTKGFLSHVAVGPFASTFNDIAGKPWADWLFMIGLAGIGIAVILGVALRPAAVAGTVLLVLMWVAEWPLAKHTSAGVPSMSTNPIVDYHVVYAATLITIAYLGSRYRSFAGAKWLQVPYVQRHRGVLS